MGLAGGWRAASDPVLSGGGDSVGGRSLEAGGESAGGGAVTPSRTVGGVASVPVGAESRGASWLPEMR